MTHSGAELLTLQGNIKRDPHGYADEFNLQWRHYKASLQLFLLSPAQGSQEFQDLVTFLSHAVGCYPAETASLSTDLMELLEKHGPLLDPSLRTSLVKALILLRNKRQLGAMELLPLLFKLFKLQDKALRQMVFRHITSDIKAANKNAKADKLNRATQSFLYSVIADEHEGTAKRGLAVLIEMWRRHVWRDARTVNVIASAVFHKSPRVMLAALKFFLGQDIAEDGDSDDEGEDGEKKNTAVSGPSKEEVYKAFHKGTVSSKKKKQKKLQRAMVAVRKAQRKEEGTGQASFAALQLLHDPQGFADKLLARLRSGGERFETRLSTMTVLSRAIGVHKLLVLNFYPFLQKYIAPAQKDVTTILAALVQACHEVVPPDVLAPVLRQLVDQFVHDKARPEVMTIGIKTVREICIRAPLVMTPELLQDLVEYKKFRDKEVSAAARGLLGLFRELAPGMLRKKDRGRGADGGILIPGEYGESKIADRIEGADLLEEALRAGKIGPDGEVLSEDEEEEDDSDLEIDSDEEEEEEEDNSGDEGEEEEEEVEGGSDDDGSELELEDSDDDNGEDEEEEESDDNEEEEEEKVVGQKRKQAPHVDSISHLKKQLAAKKAEKEDTEVPLEWGRILTQEDFETIRQLKHRKLVDAAMSKAGLKSASKRARLREAAEEEADETLALQERLGVLHEERVNPDNLLGKRRGRRDKEERLASVMEGREGREFGAKARLKKDKQGGLSNREKARRKNLPMAAKQGQVRRRLQKNSMRSKKNFKGHVKKR